MQMGRRSSMPVAWVCWLALGLAWAAIQPGGRLVADNPAIAPAPATLKPARLRFAVSLPKNFVSSQTTGRVMVVLAPAEGAPTEEPRESLGEVGLRKPVVIAADFLNPTKPRLLGDGHALHPLSSLAALPPGDYRVQAVLHTNQDLCVPNAPGDFFSTPLRVPLDPAKATTVRLELANQLPAETLPADEPHIRYLKIRSELLSRFHGRPMYLRAAVVLPRDYDNEPTRRYPLRVEIGGYGTRCAGVQGWFSTNGPLHASWFSAEAPRFLWLQLDGAGPFGDPYWVNSDNNGPYGDALVQELIPYVESTFRGIGAPHARVLSGGSTGGWVSFALQVFYPDYFNGCWSGFPDGLDFRSFQLLNIYEHTNAYVNPAGFDWPSARSVDGDVLWTVRHEVQMENALGIGDSYVRSGGQWGAWNAVYGPQAANGQPSPLWNPRTGAVDPAVVEQWKKYDLRLLLETHWPVLGPKLRGKLHCWVGEADDYFLDGGVRRMKAFLDAAQPPAEAEVRIEQELVLQSQCPVQSQLSQSQTHRMTGSEITRKMALP